MSSAMGEQRAKMRQCECGAYRKAVRIDGEWKWAAGCRACDTIERLYILLEGGVKVYRRGHDRPETLRKRLDAAEAEVERLKRQLTAQDEIIRKARNSEREARHEAYRARRAAEIKGVGDIAGNDERWN